MSYFKISVNVKSITTKIESARIEGQRSDFSDKDQKEKEKEKFIR